MECRDTFTIPRGGASGRSYLPLQNLAQRRGSVNRCRVVASAPTMSEADHGAN